MNTKIQNRIEAAGIQIKFNRSAATVTLTDSYGIAKSRRVWDNDKDAAASEMHNEREAVRAGDAPQADDDLIDIDIFSAIEEELGE